MSNNEQEETKMASLVALGSLLRQQREVRNLSIQDYAEKLKIRLNYLNSLENARPEDLPGAVFYIAFAKSYANALGLDGEEFASKIRHALQKQGLLNKLTLVTNIQHQRISPQRSSPSTEDDGSNLPSRLDKKSQPAGDKADKRSIALPPLRLSAHDKFSTKRITDANTEKQVLREMLFSPLFIFGGVISLVLLYLGGVIVTDLLGEHDKATLTSVQFNASDEPVTDDPASETVLEEEDETIYEPKVYGALGATRVMLEAREKCWIAVFATESEPGLEQEAELLFAGTLETGDRYRVPVQLGIILKSGNLHALRFVVHGVEIEPFRIESPSGFMSLEPVHLRNQTSIREGGALARERLPVVREIELLREQRAEEALEKQKATR